MQIFLHQINSKILCVALSYDTITIVTFITMNGIYTDNLWGIYAYVCRYKLNFI